MDTREATEKPAVKSSIPENRVKVLQSTTTGGLLNATAKELLKDART